MAVQAIDMFPPLLATFHNAHSVPSPRWPNLQSGTVTLVLEASRPEGLEGIVAGLAMQDTSHGYPRHQRDISHVPLGESQLHRKCSSSSPAPRNQTYHFHITTWNQLLLKSGNQEPFWATSDWQENPSNHQRRPVPSHNVYIVHLRVFLSSTFLKVFSNHDILSTSLHSFCWHPKSEFKTCSNTSCICFRSMNPNIGSFFALKTSFVRCKTSWCTNSSNDAANKLNLPVGVWKKTTETET